MYKKDVSVIVVTFNGAKYIRQQLESILKQTLAPAEIIACDDNSTDETISILKEYEAAGKLKLFVNSKQLGVVVNCKKAVMLVNEENLVAFADQDDIWVTDKLRQLFSEMQLLDDGVTPALIYSDLAVIDKQDKIIAASFWEKQHIMPAKINLATLLYGNAVTGCTMMINYPMAREFFKMENYEFYHDEWLALIAYTIGKVKYINQQLVLYRQHENNITFSEEYETSFAQNSLIINWQYFLGKHEFLPARLFGLAKTFLLSYRNRLTGEQIKIIQNFLKQQSKNYLVQRFNRRITFS